MPFSRGRFAFANFDFQSGTASIDPSPLDDVCEDLAPLPPSTTDWEASEPEIFEVPMDCQISLRIAGIRKNLYPELYRAPKELPKVVVQPPRLRRPSKTGSKRSSVSSGHSSLLGPIPENSSWDDGIYPANPIVIIVTDTDEPDEDERNWLIEVDTMTLAPSFPCQNNLYLPVTKATVQAPELKCREVGRNYQLSVPLHSTTSVRYSPRKCNVCMDMENKQKKELREAAVQRKNRPAPTPDRMHSRSNETKQSAQRFYSLKVKPLFKPNKA